MEEARKELPYTFEGIFDKMSKCKLRISYFLLLQHSSILLAICNIVTFRMLWPELSFVIPFFA